MMKIFRMAGVDVSLSMLYPLLFPICMYIYSDIVKGLLAAIAITLSVLIHEYGHALMSKRYHLSPSIVIHVLGGVCYHTPADTDRKDVMIVIAGPLAQIAAGILGLGALFGMGLLNAGLVSGALTGRLDGLQVFLTIFCFFSIFWGVVNLMAPIWPLDGGKLSALILRRFMDEDAAAKWALRISIGALSLAGIYAVYSRSMLLGFMILHLFMQNVQLLQSEATLFDRRSSRSEAKRRQMSPQGEELLRGAYDAFEQQDWRESARLIHQLRASKEPIAPNTMNELWQMLGLANLELGEYQEALEWLRRAPQSPRVEAAIARCEAELRR